MSDIETKIIEAIRINGPMRASRIGEEIWAESNRIKQGRLYGRNLPQRFARPAGKILKKMRERGLVQINNKLEWYLTHCKEILGKE